VKNKYKSILYGFGVLFGEDFLGVRLWFFRVLGNYRKIGAMTNFPLIFRFKNENPQFFRNFLENPKIGIPEQFQQFSPWFPAPCFALIFFVQRRKPEAIQILPPSMY
jgi:hypothetical protein